MYSGQKLSVKTRLLNVVDSRFRQLVRIDTVDSYQGGENANRDRVIGPL